ncbi:TPA: replication endonuclease [Escherichia coli]|nr:replication endonuclease [Escherichia coli]HBE4963161.1 replication endonuclease [Escherichia coli]
MTVYSAGGPRTPELEEELAFTGEVDRAFSGLPRFVSVKLGRRISSAWITKGFSGAREKFALMLQRDLPCIIAVNKRYAINPDELPGWLFGGLASDQAYGAIHAMTWRFNALADGDDGDAHLLAKDLAEFLIAEMQHLSGILADEDAVAAAGAIYAMVSGLVEHFRMEPPDWKRFISRKLTLEQVTVAISRMLSVRWWAGKLKTLSRRWREHLLIAMGGVRRQASPHCSYEWVQRWMAGRKHGRRIMAGTEIEDEDTGEKFSLLDFVDSSISDAEKRRAELMTRVKGLEDLARFEGVAQEQGYTGLFFTMTAPSKYHAWLETGYRNRRYNGASPKDTQNYFSLLWRQISATLRRRGIGIFGLRSAEPHHDGTPHWHGVLYVHGEHEAALREVMEYYANREEDAENAGTRRAGRKSHLEIKPVLDDLGSASAYIAKHIGMNLDGCAPGGMNHETGHTLVVTARHASAWASMWGIKQFQFIGSAPVSVWRELRRFNNQAHADRISPELGRLHRAASEGDWKTYTRLQGGPFVARSDLVLRTWYQCSEEPDECGRHVSAIKGVYMPGRDTPPVPTRVRRWKITRNVTADSLKINRGPAVTPWTCVNNCISGRKRPDDRLLDCYLKIPIQLELDLEEVKKGTD